MLITNPRQSIDPARVDRRARPFHHLIANSALLRCTVHRSVGRPVPTFARFLSATTYVRIPPHGEQGVNGQRLMVPLSLSLTLPRSASPRLSFSLAVPLSFSLCFSPPSPSLHLSLFLSLFREESLELLLTTASHSRPAPRCFFPHSVLHLRSLLLPPFVPFRGETAALPMA